MHDAYNAIAISDKAYSAAVAKLDERERASLASLLDRMIENFGACVTEEDKKQVQRLRLARTGL